ncbi:MAG: DUF4079 domain-containing protein [Chloroflexaceae bacterium]|nr:DUF4079 domain-containing protein [Chloroflexaceae bacterium]
MSFEIPESVKVWSQFFHPVLMWVLLGAALYSLYSGVQITRTRTADKEVRKELVQKGFILKHHYVGSALLALMVMGTVGGMAVTYMIDGKLYFGPHLLVGLGMTAMIATSAAMVPFMQKGQDWARYTHWVMNLTLLGLFGWQAVTGMQIVQKAVTKLLA